MYKRFCALCGKNTEKLYHNICIECYKSKIDNIKIPSEIFLKECKICGSLCSDNHYFKKREINQEKFLKKIILKVIREKTTLNTNIFTFSLIGIKKISYESNKSVLQADVMITRHMDKTVLYNINKKVKVIIKYYICRNCRVDFYKNKRIIIQIRAKNRLIEGEERKDILQIIKSTIRSAYENEEKISFIDVKERERGSIDIKLNSKSLANKIINNLKKRYPLSILITSKTLRSTPKKEEKYQTTIRLLLPTIKVGDIIEINKKYYFIKKIDKGKITIISLENHKKQFLNKMSLFTKKYNVVDRIKYRCGVIISKSKNSIQFMDVKDYHIYDVSLEFIPKEKMVKYILINNKPFILPQKI